MSEVSVTSITDKANNFLKSNWAITIFLGGIILVSIINFLSFGFSLSSVKTIWWGEISRGDSLAWIAWTKIITSGVGSSLGIYGMILALRFDKKFIYPIIAGDLIGIFSTLIVGWLFTTVSFGLMTCCTIYGYLKWDENDTTPKVNNWDWLIVILFIVIYISIGLFVMSIIIEGSLNFIAYNDVINSSILVVAWYLVMKKSKWGFILFVVVDIFYITANIIIGVYVGAFACSVYLLIDVVSLLGWWNSN